MKGHRILTAFGGILAAGLLGATSFAITGDAPADLPPPLPPPGALVGAAGPDGEPIICPDGQALKVEAPGPPPDIPSGPDVEDSVPQTPIPPEELEAQPLVPSCGPNDEPVWEPLGDETSTVHSLGFDGTCDVSATVSHRLLSDNPLWAPDDYEFVFNATGSCTGHLDDEEIQGAPLTFSLYEGYQCGLTTKGFDPTNLSSTLNFSGTFAAGIDAAIDVSVDYRGDKPSPITGRESGAAVLTGTPSPGVSSCRDSTGTFTGQLQTLQPLQG
jgi:hypothetical protein